MNKLTYFAIICLFSSLAFANDPAHEKVMTHNSVMVSNRAPTEFVDKKYNITFNLDDVLSQSTIKARTDHISNPSSGHILVTDIMPMGRITGKDVVAKEFLVHAVWQDGAR